MKYIVEVTFHASEMVEIEADDAEEARQSAVNMVADRDLLAEDLENTEWVVGDAKAEAVQIEVK